MELVRLKFGKLQMDLEEGGLRYISYGGFEIVRGIYAAVRDRDWGTVAPGFEDVGVQEDPGGITVAFRACHVRDDVDFVWNGTIRIEADEVRFDFEGEARSAFMKNRIGFCVLHPMEFAGLPIEIASSTGSIQGQFPASISPHQPFKEMNGISYEPVRGLKVAMSFEGDVFEMEDQRNWTDASYKTYCTPLELPFPVQIAAGQQIRQSIVVRIQEQAGFEMAADKDSVVNISVREDEIRKLPGIGFVIPDGAPNDSERDWLRKLKPAHLRLVLDVTGDDWRVFLNGAASWAHLYGCVIELELLVDAENQMKELAQFMATENVPVSRILPFQTNKFIVDQATLRMVKRIVQSEGLAIQVGGGARTYYAEHNRAELPLSDMDFTSYSINPQVHAFDDHSLMETLSAQPVTATDAIAKTGKSLHIGPITMKPRINPNATSGDFNIPVEGQTDERQTVAFGAAWTLGSAAALCGASTKALESITYYELFGPVGLVNGEAYPLYEVLMDLTAEPEAEVLSVQIDSACVSAMALRSGGRTRLLLANLTGKKQAVEIHNTRTESVRVSLQSYQYACHTL